MAIDGRLSEPEDWFGYFWPPGRMKEEAIPGHLTYRPDDGPKVRLIGGFGERVLPAVHGSIERIPITLLDCVATSTRMIGFDPVPVHQDIDPQRVLYGINLNDAAETCFKAMTIEVENLSQWSAEKDINLQFEYGDRRPASSDETDQSAAEGESSEQNEPGQTGATGHAGWGINAKPADERVAQVGEITVTLRRSYSLPNWDNRRERTVVGTSGKSVLHFSSTRSRSIDEWEEIARMAQDLLSLATFSPCAVLRQTLFPDDERHASDSTVRTEVHVYTQQLVTGAPNEPAMIAWEMLFNLSDIDFQLVLPQWVKVREMLRPTCNMILGLKYLPGGYLETKLLTATGAAEIMESSLAQGLNRPLPVPKEKFKALRQELLGVVAEEYRDWLDKKLYNAPSLQDKLKLLVSQFDNQITQALLPNVELWAQRTTYARNDLTHRGESQRVPPLEMSAVADVTVAVVVIALLSQLEIPTPRILQALEHHPDLKRAPELAQRYWPAGAAAGR